MDPEKITNDILNLTDKMNIRQILLNRLIAAMIFIATLIVYTMTMAPTVSFWDCGEFAACSYNLAVPHPPGTPLFILIGRVFSFLPVGQDIALRINFISALASALSISLLYLVIERLARYWTSSTIAMASGAIGALTFAFTHSFWFNAVESEVYALATFFIILPVWLILVWASRANEFKNDRLILLIAYILGLAAGVHFMSVLVLPFIVLIYARERIGINRKTLFGILAVSLVIFLVIYPGIVKYVPVIVSKLGIPGLIVAVSIPVLLTYRFYKYKNRVVQLILASVVLVMIGYSTYFTIVIRSGLDPGIDINNPDSAENLVKYVSREQYGQHSILDRSSAWKNSPNATHYHSTSQYFWNYQIYHMYVRYFLWNFVGMNENGRDWSFNLWALPLVLGIIGFGYQFRRDPGRALAVLSLFIMTGLAIVIYINQPDPQPRERDYSYVGSFMAFTIWSGLGFAALMRVLKLSVSSVKWHRYIFVLAFIVIMIIVPGHILLKNYHSHDRSQRFIAWDYAYNILQTCAPNSILFTGGDNDTYPLWYLQEVEGIRRDVRVVNLELLNTQWYVGQLRDMEPRVPMNLTDAELDRLGFIPWTTRKVSFNVPHDKAVKYLDEYKISFTGYNLSAPREISFAVPPTFNTPYGSVLCVRDSMILRILQANKWQRPVYFSETISRNSYPRELNSYLCSEGMAARLVPIRNWAISPQKIYQNLLQVYKFRNLDCDGVYYDQMMTGYLQNYRNIFLRLIEYEVRIKNIEEAQNLFSIMSEKMPDKNISWSNRQLKLIRDIYGYALTQVSKAEIMHTNYSRDEYIYIGQILARLGFYEKAENMIREVHSDTDAHTFRLLVHLLDLQNKSEKCRNMLRDWLKRYPDDTFALAKLEQL